MSLSLIRNCPASAGEFLSLFKGSKNTKTCRHSEIKQTRSLTKQLFSGEAIAYLSNTLTNLCIALYCILLSCVVLNCIALLIYCYVDIIQYNAMHKFVGVLDNPQQLSRKNMEAELASLPCNSSLAQTKWSTIFASGVCYLQNKKTVFTKQENVV